MTELNTAAVIDAAVPASPEVAEQGARKQIRAAVNAVEAVRKAELPEAVEAAVLAPLNDHLGAAVAEFGAAVARGNTVWIAVDGKLVTIDISPGVLPRV